jgi:hypothetical protein
VLLYVSSREIAEPIIEWTGAVGIEGGKGRKAGVATPAVILAVLHGAFAPLGSACEHAFGLSSKGSIVGQLQRALAKRDLLAVRSLAGELPSVPLPIAAQITLLLLEKEPEAYVPAARRLLARLAAERAMALQELAGVAAILAELETDPAISRAPRLISLVHGGTGSQ